MLRMVLSSTQLLHAATRASRISLIQNAKSELPAIGAISPIVIIDPLFFFQLRGISSDGNETYDKSTDSIVSSATRKSSLADDDDDKKQKSPSKGILGAYADLSKARLSALVVTTTAAGFMAAGPEPLAANPWALVSVLAGTALCSGSASAWNQIFEANRDAQMKRTRHRPLVTGVLSKPHAVTAALAWGSAGLGLLYAGTDPFTTALGAGNLLLYAGPYTALKPYSTLNTWVGAFVGAIPPVMGYTAASMTAAAAAGGGADLYFYHHVWMDPVAWSLGATLYLWQLPHFMALSYMHRTDYARGGFCMVPCHTVTGAPSANVAAQHTADIIVRYAWYLAAVPVVSSFVLNITSSMYALEGIALNAYALAVAHRFHRERTNANARKIFLTSLWYLPCTLMLFLLHSKSWDEKKQQQTTTAENALSQFLAEHIRAARNSGRELCLHETAAVQRRGSKACPVVIATESVDHAVQTVDRAAVSAVTTATAETIAVAPISNERKN